MIASPYKIRFALLSWNLKRTSGKTMPVRIGGPASFNRNSAVFSGTCSITEVIEQL
jgi:hypothetical protein